MVTKNPDSLPVDRRRHLYAEGKYMGQNFYWYMEIYTKLSTNRKRHLWVERLDAVYH